MSDATSPNEISDWIGSRAGVALPAEQPRAWLTWTDPAGEEHQRPLGSDTRLVIGRTGANDIVLRDQGVSRRHTLIAATADGAFIVSDLGSSNGTTINERLIAAPTELQSGDRITVGQTVFTFTVAAQLDMTSAPRVVAATLAPDGATLLPVSRTTAGWLTLPSGERRILGSETRIGRSAKNDITLDDSQASRNHAHIRRIDETFMLSDLGSANGVQVNGEPVLAPRELRDGDQIQIGGARLGFSLVPLAPATDGSFDTMSLVQAGTGLFTLADLATPEAMKGDLRVVTVLFCDMHGFTALSERLNNPELTTALINRVFETLTAEIVRYDGSIDKYAGDGIMALFGAPRAHEDDPERAIKAALAMQRALEGFNRRLRRDLNLKLQMRTGINTGEVVFGQVGGGDYRSYTVMGDTVNLASRLEHAARVGHILVGETTYALSKHAFHFTALPPLEVKGKREPIQAYEVGREKRADEVLREPAGGELLIGREHELQQLRVTLDDAVGGQGRLVAVVGDVGIGTSQLLAAFQQAYSQPDTTWMTERCLSYNATAPYALLTGLLRSLLDLECDEAVARAKLLAALKAVLGQLDDQIRAQYLALLGQILGVQINNAFVAGLEPKVRHKLTTAMLRALVAARTARGPLVLVLEELQWADSASVDALDELVDVLPELPVLLLLAYRPQWRHTWAGRSFYRQITLSELSQNQSRRLLRQLLRVSELPDTVADSIYRQCGGNPLLLEETVKSLRERDVLVQRNGRWTLTSDVPQLNIPSTLRGIMMARIDGLDERDRAVLQMAAVIGRSFTYRLLALVTGLEDALDESLAVLKDREIIQELPLATEPEFAFKHSIVQEIAYNNVLVADRRVLHERIGDALERIGADRPDDQLEVLAHHYSRGANKRKAIDYLTKSGEKARRLYANETAIAQFEEALTKCRALSRAEQDPRQLVRLYELLGDVQLLTADFRRAQENYEAGLAAATSAALPPAQVWNKLGLVWERRGDYRKALASYEQGLATLGRDATARDFATLQVSAARAQTQRGNYARAVELAQTALTGIERQFGPDERRIRADALHVLGLAAYASGAPDDAITYYLQSLQLRQDLADTMGMQESYNQLGALYWSRGQLEHAFAHLVSLTQVLRLNVGDLALPDDPALAVNTERDDAAPDDAGLTPPDSKTAPIEHYYRSGLAAARRVGDLWSVTVSCNRLGGMLYQQGEHERALHYLHKALTEAERIGAREVAAQASISLGAIAASQGDAGASLSYLERGLTYAEAVESAVTLAEGQIRLAEAKLLAGDRVGALAAAEAGLRIAGESGHQFMRGLAHRVLGQVVTAHHDWHSADQHFRVALDLLAGVDAQQEVGRAYYHFALMWRDWATTLHQPLPDGVTEMLQQAAQIFIQLDMQQDLALARAALVA